MGLLNWLIIITLFTLPISQIARYQYPGGVAITLADIFVGVICLIWGIRAIRENKNKNYLLKPIFLFVGAAVFSLLWNSYILLLPQIFVSFLYLLRWVLYSFVGMAVLEQGKSSKEKIKKFMLIAGGLTVAMGYFQYIFYQPLGNVFYLGWDNHLFRMFSGFLDPNFAGAFFVLYFLFILNALFKTGKKRTGFVYGILALHTVLAVFLTHSRSSILMLVVSSSLFFILMRKFKLIIGIFICVILFILVSSPFYYLENINLFRIVSTEARVDSAKNALTIIKDHPLFGVGFNAYRYAQLRYEFRNIQGIETSHADAGTDNSFLFVLATAGIVGLIFYLNIWRTVLRKTRSPVFVASIAGLFVDSLFVNSLFFTPIMLWMWFLVGVTDSK